LKECVKILGATIVNWKPRVHKQYQPRMADL
jgi:hypothetical protein